MQKLLDALEALDDVQEVYTTAVIEELSRGVPLDRRILGIDPGLRITGFGVLDIAGATGSSTSRAAASERSGGDALAMRLKTILDGLAAK